MGEESRHGSQVTRCAEELARRLQTPPELFLVLGSGLSNVADAMAEAVEIRAPEVAGLPSPNVAGHVGLLRAGWLGEVRVLAQLGRVHLYEGYSPAEVTRSVEVAAELGCSTFVVTNSAGGLDERCQAGELVAILDQLNLTSASPLVGVGRDEEQVFVDMVGAYDPQLREAAFDVAAERGLQLRSGIYAGVIGPAYETPAEVAMLRRLGADLVGMSTVLEVIAARARGLRVLGLSVVTNVPGATPTSHPQVLAVGRTAAPRLGQLVRGVIERIGQMRGEPPAVTRGHDGVAEADPLAPPKQGRSGPPQTLRAQAGRADLA